MVREAYHHALHVRLFSCSNYVLQRASQEGPVVNHEVGARNDWDALAEAWTTPAIPAGCHERSAAAARAVCAGELSPWLGLNVHN